MKIPLAVLLSLAAGCFASAQTAQSGTTTTKQKGPVRIILPSDKPEAAQPSTDKTGKTPPAKDAKAKDAKDAKKTAKKDEPEKIKGIEIARSSRGFLGIQIVDSTFRLWFYDAEKKPVAADMDRAALRWDPKYKVGEERVVLTRSDDGKSLSSLKNIRPPYNFKLFITLLKDATESGAGATENYTIDFRQ